MGFVTPNECAEIMYGSALLADKVVRLAQAHVLDSVYDGGGRWLIRPAVVGVTRKIGEELLP